MRNDGWRLRYIGWAVLIVLIVGAAAVAIGLKLGLVGDKRTYIDINSGDIATDQTLLGYPFSHAVAPTDFSNLSRKMGVAQGEPDWRPLVQFSWLSGTKADFPMHGADVACAGAMWRLRNEKTDDAKKKLLAHYANLLRAGDEKGMEDLSRKVGVEQEQRAKTAGGADRE